MSVDDTFVATFLDTCCESSPFDYEYVLEDELALRYADFERSHQCLGLYPLKASILKTLGHRMVQIPLRVVIPKAKVDDFQEHVNVAGVSALLMEMGEQDTQTVEQNDSRNWFTWMIFEVVVNLILFFSLPLPVTAVVFLYQHEANVLALERDRFFTIEQLLLGPESTASRWPDSHIAVQNQVLLFGIMLYW